MIAATCALTGFGLIPGDHTNIGQVAIALRNVQTKADNEFYSVDVQVDEKELAQMSPKVVLYPGMPVETMIVTGKRTLLGYLLQPLTDTFRSAFREQ